MQARRPHRLTGRTLLGRRLSSRGQALVELALILPVMLTMFAAALDLGRLYYANITIANAAKEGAIEATLHPSSFDNTRGCDINTNRVICLVVNEAKDTLVSIDPSDVTLACDPSPCPTTPAIGDTVEVTVVSDFSLVSPLLAVFFGGQSFQIAASSTAQLSVNPSPGATPTPSPSPSPTPDPTPTPTPDPSPTPEPTPTPTPTCTIPVVAGTITISPGSGRSQDHPSPTTFTMTAPAVAPQPGCAFTYTWSFGDGASASGESVTHQYAHKGNGPGKSYQVTLAISATLQPLTWTGTQTVVVNP